ncbi:MAG: PAS domain-containing protein [Caldisericia bacterium]
MMATLNDVKREGGRMNPDNPASSSRHKGAGATDRPTRWFRRARSGATLAVCLYVVVWSALLGDFADNLTIDQEVLMAGVALVSGVLIWTAVRALILEQRFLARQESMEALEESRAFIRALMDNLPAAVWLKSRDHRYLAGNLPWVQTNPMLPRWQSRKLEELIGHTDRELFAPEHALEFETTDDIVFETGQGWAHDYDDVQGGEHRLYHTVKMPVWDIRGSVVNVVGIGFDVTEIRRNEQELKRSQEQLDIFLNRSSEHICMVSPDRRIVVANARLYEFLGVPVPSLVGRDVVDVVMPADRSRCATFFGQLLLGESEPLEVVDVQNASGLVRQVEISGTLVRTGGSPDMVVIIGRDVTGRNSSYVTE